MMDADDHLTMFLRNSFLVWTKRFEEPHDRHGKLPRVLASELGVAHWYPTAVLGTLSQALGRHPHACVDTMIDMFLHPDTGVDAIRYYLDLAKFLLREQQRSSDRDSPSPSTEEPRGAVETADMSARSSAAEKHGMDSEASLRADRRVPP